MSRKRNKRQAQLKKGGGKWIKVVSPNDLSEIQRGAVAVQLRDLPEFQSLERRVNTVAILGHWTMLLLGLHATWSVSEGAALAGEGQKLKETVRGCMGPMADAHALIIKYMNDCGFPRGEIEIIESITAHHLQGIQNILDGKDQGELLRDCARQGPGVSEALEAMIERQKGGAPTGPRPVQSFILRSVIEMWKNPPDGRKRSLSETSLYFFGQLCQKYQDGIIADGVEREALEKLKGRDVVDYVNNLYREHREWLKSLNLLGGEN